MISLLTDHSFLLTENRKRPTDPPPPSIADYVEGKRILPSGTPFPGPWSNARTPYLVEIMESMSPYSPVIEDSTMKGAQLGVTAAAENVCGFWMDAYPTEIMYISATDELTEKWSVKRLDPMIYSMGFRDKIFAQTENTKTRRSGDKIYSKQYIGGALDIASAQSAGSLRSDSKRVLITDEVDGAPRNLRTGEGNWLSVALARTNAWGHRKKIMTFSTPTTFEDSLILERYGMGDQRKYFVPCPHCQKDQILNFKRLHPENKAGVLEYAYYLCEFCNDAVFNHHKTQMLNAGHWEPTSEANSKNHRSRQISSMYSPVGMLSWTEMYQAYLNAKLIPEGMRSFVNLYLGEPYKELGSRPKVENVIELRGGYREGDVPNDVLFSTMFVDVQSGSETDPNNPARLELEVCGHGKDFRTWSILYRSFIGAIDDPFDGAWEEMHEWAENGGLVFKKDNGNQIHVNLVLIDSGDGNYTDIVYAFTSRWQNTYPSKGFSALKKRKGEKGDEIGPANFKKYRRAKTEKSGDVLFYEIATNFYKTRVYNNLKIQRQPIDPQKPMFCEFPRDRGEKYFDMLTAEEKRKDGSFHSGGRRNEALDCRVGNLCACDIFLDAKVSDMRAGLKIKGATELQLQQINHKFVLDWMEKNSN